MAHERPHDPVAVLGRHRLDRRSHITEPIAGLGGGDASLHPGPRRVDELAHAWRRVADDEAAGAVGVPSVPDAADVKADHVTLGDAPLR